MFLPLIDPADIGASAARVLADLGVGHEGRCYEISGPARLSLHDIAAVFTKVQCGDASVSVWKTVVVPLRPVQCQWGEGECLVGLPVKLV